MSTKSTVESDEELYQADPIKLSDIQPLCDTANNGILKTNFLDIIYIDTVGNDDTNIGSMVSIQSDDSKSLESTGSVALPEVIVPCNEDCDNVVCILYLQYKTRTKIIILI